MSMNWDEFLSQQPRLVLYKEQMVDVAEFVGMPLKERPTDVYCPECGEQVILKLGNILRPHYAHHPSSGCSGSSESYDHWQTKGELAAKLNTVTQLAVYMRCRKCHDFRLTHTPPVQGWEAAHEEYTIGKYRADVALVDPNGAVLLAIEVLVTHEVDDEKRAFFEQHRIPWAEVLPNDNTALVIVNGRLHLNASRFGNLGIKDVLCHDCQQGNTQTIIERSFADEWVLAEQYPVFDHNGHLLWQSKYESVTDSRRLPLLKTQTTGRALDDIGKGRYLLRIKFIPEKSKRR